MATHVFTPEFANHVRRAKELNNGESKDIYYHPTERGIVEKSIDLASPKPMSEVGRPLTSSSKDRWLAAYLIREAKKHNWMLQFGERQYRVRYSQGQGNRNGLRYFPCGETKYRAEYPQNGKEGGTLRYSQCGEKEYRVEYSHTGNGRSTPLYAPCGEQRYRAQYSDNGESQNGIHYVQCGRKQYRLLCSELNLGRERKAQGNEHGVPSMLMFDETARNLVILVLKGKRELDGAKAELDTCIERLRECKSRLKKAFDLDEIRGVVGYIMWPANGKKSNDTRMSYDLGKHGLIEYKELSKPWEEFSRTRREGKDFKIRFTCHRTAQSTPLG
ncbi:MAG: hypothetical protein V3S51_08485 [Dehalococcoidia bacterium]